MTRFLLAAVALVVACSSSQTSQPAPQPTPAAVRASDPAGPGTPSTAARLGIPPGHLPAPGECRVWVQGRPPGHQAKPGPCAEVSRTAPAGSWIVYRPTSDRKVVHVREVDSTSPGRVVRVRIFDAITGAFLRDEAP